MSKDQKHRLESLEEDVKNMKKWLNETLGGRPEVRNIHFLVDQISHLSDFIDAERKKTQMQININASLLGFIGEKFIPHKSVQEIDKEFKSWLEAKATEMPRL